MNLGFKIVVKAHYYAVELCENGNVKCGVVMFFVVNFSLSLMLCHKSFEN